MAEDPTVIIWVAVPLSQAEYRRLNSDRWLTAPGTTWAVLRERLGLQHSPLRLTRESTEHRILYPDGVMGAPYMADSVLLRRDKA